MAATFAGAFAGERVVSPVGEALVARMHGGYLRRSVRSESRLCRPSTRHGQQEGMAATFAGAFAGERVVSPVDEARAARRHGSYLRRSVRSESRLCRPSTRHGQQEGMAATFARTFVKALHLL